MLCGSGYCNRFHRWGNTGLNLHQSHAERHANTQQSKNTTDSYFQFPVLMNAIYHTFKRKLRHTLYETFYTPCTGTEVFSHELLFCKCVVLQTVYLSVVNDMMFPKVNS